MKTAYNDKITKIFSDLPFVEIKAMAKMMNTDDSNLRKQIKGDLPISLKRYTEIMNTLQKMKDLFP